jgi:flagellar protein FliL
MSKTLTMVLIGVCLFSLCLTAISFIVMYGKISKIEQKYIENDSDDEEMDENLREPGFIHSIGSFIVNLKNGGGARYARVNMDLELENEQAKAEIEKRMSQMRDMILMIISSKGAEDIQTVEGKQALRKEVLDSLNGIMRESKIQGLFFTEFVIQ